MSDDVKLSLIWGTVIVAVVSSLCWSISWYHTTVIRTAMENGYSQQTLHGASGTHWVKDEPK